MIMWLQEEYLGNTLEAWMTAAGIALAACGGPVGTADLPCASAQITTWPLPEVLREVSGLTFTDDSVLTVAVAHAILKGGDYASALRHFGR